MKVEVLYISECPSHPAAVKLVKDVLAAEGVAAAVHEMLVQDRGMANELKFLGSPTVRINSKDVAEETQTAGTLVFGCRLYAGSKQVGLPAAEWVHRAVTEALGTGERRNRGRQFRRHWRP